MGENNSSNQFDINSLRPLLLEQVREFQQNGMGKKGFTQVENTLQRVNGTYSSSKLILNDEKTAVLVPLNYLLLI